MGFFDSIPYCSHLCCCIKLRPACITLGLLNLFFRLVYYATYDKFHSYGFVYGRTFYLLIVTIRVTQLSNSFHFIVSKGEFLCEFLVELIIDSAATVGDILLIIGAIKVNKSHCLRSSKHLIVI